MASRKPLTAGEIEELKNEIRTMPHKEFFGENLQLLVDDHSRLSAMLTPPPDAAVREAVERISSLADNLATASKCLMLKDTVRNHSLDLRTLLRAVQAPRLTGEQMEAVQVAASLLKGKNGDRAWARRKLESAFPEAFAGEVGRG